MTKHIASASFSALHDEFNVAADLRAALHEGRLELFGQSIVDVCSETDRDCPHKIEILIRMRDRAGNVVSPGHFIPAAERYGVMAEVDRWVIATLFDKCCEAAEAGLPRMACSINLSANSLDDIHFWDYVRSHLERSKVPPSDICFEITETCIIQNLSSAIHFVTSAQEYGCRIALDDFGVGLSSFSYLRDFKVDELKIDGSFIRGIADSAINAQVVKAILSVGKTLGIACVAEWVEDVGTLEKVREMGVDRAQGYHFGAPRPLEDYCATHS
ncbi:EAL domain-containing protein [Amorphus coralli]|uniref:EAL domain-containing protein n=1 Tax=Amorphus coralli TaxID=340680 RepID=UPI00037771AE|nr:EAL domain-containing protein [Amorphus coralli]